MARTREWVEEQAALTPGFCGAHLKGSLLATPEHAAWPSHRDVDVNVLVEGASESHRFTDILYQGLLIDCTWIDVGYYRSAEDVLTNLALAPNLAVPGAVLADPSGRLGPLAEEVVEQYPQEPWVRARIQRCREAAAVRRAALDTDSPLEAATALWELVGRIGAQLAVAHLRSPTHRRCLVLSGELLRASGRPEVHESLLELSGFSDVTAEQARGLVEQCEVLFDRARAKLATGGKLPPGSRFRPQARDYVLAGSRAMIDEGHPREAMHWIVAQTSLALGVLLRLEEREERPRLQALLQEIVTRQGLGTEEGRLHRLELADSVCRNVDHLVDNFLSTTYGWNE